MAGRKNTRTEEQGAKSPFKLIDDRIGESDDWRGETLARVRSFFEVRGLSH